MDTGSYEYSQYETTAEFDSRMNTIYSSAQPQSQSMLSQQAGVFTQPSLMGQQSGPMPQQSGMMSQQSSMSQQWGTMSHQTGTMPQQTGTMSQQSGTMSQQSGVMSQQSGTWSSTNSSGMQQSGNTWMQTGTMGGSNNPNFSQQGAGSFNNPSGNYQSQQSGSFGPSGNMEMYNTGQNRGGPQQFSNMSQQQMSGYGGQQQQGGGNNMNNDNTMSYSEGDSSFQGSDSMSNYQQDNSFGYQGNTWEGNCSSYQGNNYGSENTSSFQQSGQNVMHQQGSAGMQYQQNNRSSANQQGPGFQQGNRGPNQQGQNYQQGNMNMNQQGQNYQQGNIGPNQQGTGYQQGNRGPNQQGTGYQQGNRGLNQQGSNYPQGNKASFQPNTRNMAGMNDSLNEFYSEIENVTQKTGPNYQHQSFPNPGFDPQSSQVSSTQSSGMQRNMGQKPHTASSNQTATWKSGTGNGNVAKGVNRQFPTQEPDSSTPGHSGRHSKISEYADEDTEYCKLCNVYFTSAPLYALHARGLSHIQRVMAVEAGVDRKAAAMPYILSGKNYTQTVPQEADNTGTENETGKQTGQNSDEPSLNAGCYCEICDIYVNSERMLWRHYQGKKHLKALKAVQLGELQVKPMEERPVDPNVQRASELMESQVPKEEVSILNFAFDTMPEDEPVVGLGFLVETMEKLNQVMECELCKTKGNLYNMVQHVLGLKHRLQYMKVRDRERYDRVNKLAKKTVQAEEVRVLCTELERIEGRGTARYRGPPRTMANEQTRRILGRAATPPPAHLLRYREQQNLMSAAEKRVAVEALKRTLLDDFQKRNMDPDTATKVLNSRMELLAEYEKRGVPFAVARERVIEEEERWNLLLEFERQVLSFDEAEQRIDHRFELMRMYEKNGIEREEARRKVLDDEVIYDFRREFVRLGLQKEQAQKLAEKRLWMLEHLHLKGLTPEAASKRIIGIERDLRKFLRAMFEADRRGRGRESHRAQWMVAGEELEKYVVYTCKDLGLPADLTEEQVSLALEAFDKYRRHRIPADEAKCRVLVDDLPIPRQQSDSGPAATEGESTNDPGSQADITNRVLQFKSKLNAVIQTTTDSSDGDKEKEADTKEAEVVDVEKQLADYDQQSRMEIQNLLSDMLKMKVPADEARKRLVALYKQHENLRENLFPAKKQLSISGKTNKSNMSAESKTAEKAPTKTEDKSSKENQASQDESATKATSEKDETSSKEKPATEESMVVEDNKEKTSEEVAQSKASTEKEKPQGSGDTSGKSSETKKVTTANDRWNSSVEMFLQQYGLSKEEYRSQMNKRRSSGHDRYSPSDLSPRRSKSKSVERPRRSPNSGKERSPQASRDRDSNRREKRRRSRSRSRSSRWSKMLRSRLRSRSPSDRRRSSPGHRSRQGSGERELDPRGPRRSPGRRSPFRRSPGRRSPFRRSPGRRSPGRRSPRRWSPGHRRSPRFSPFSRSRFSPGRRSPPRRRSPFGRRSPFNRRSPGHRSPDSRGLSPGQSWGRPADFDQYAHGHRFGRSRSRDRHDSPWEFGSPEMHRVREPLSSRDRPRWDRQRSPTREPEFNFAEGVWPDVDDPWD